MSGGPWRASIRVRRTDRVAADRLYRALSPEAEREVPRARSTLTVGPGPLVSLTIRTQDTGALRAALNTYLGWIDLAETTERTVAGPRPAAATDVPEAVK